MAHQLFEVLVRRRDDAHVRLQRLRSSHALECALLAHHPQQFHLRAGLNLSDFVEKNGPAACLLKSSNATLMGPRKCAAFMPE